MDVVTAKTASGSSFGCSDMCIDQHIKHIFFNLRKNVNGIEVVLDEIFDSF
jgi:hypothetical protein